MRRGERLALRAHEEIGTHIVWLPDWSVFMARVIALCVAAWLALWFVPGVLIDTGLKADRFCKQALPVPTAAVCIDIPPEYPKAAGDRYVATACTQGSYLFLPAASAGDIQAMLDLCHGKHPFVRWHDKLRSIWAVNVQEPSLEEEQPNG